MLRVKLPHLARWTAMRRDNAWRYDALFTEAGLAGRITLPIEPARRRHIFNQYVVRVPDRDRVRARLDGARHRHRDLLPRAVPPAGVFRLSRYTHEEIFRDAEAAAATTLALPIYGELTVPNSRRPWSAPSALRSGRDADPGHRRARPPRRRDCARVPGRARTSIAFDREHLDVSNETAVIDAVAAVYPDVVINCAAYNDVDGAEHEPDAALRVNAFGVLALARAARRASATLVHYSTDFVFDGETDRPYTEEDRRTRAASYAASKLLGDWFALDAPRAYVLRVESLFGEPGPGQAPRGSLATIVDRIRNGAEVPVFVDRTVSPSYTADVAAATRAMIEGGVPPGLYHCVNAGAASWAQIAEEAARLIGRPLRMKPLTLESAALTAPPPALLRAVDREAGVRGDCDAVLAGRAREISQDRNLRSG